MHSIVTQYMVGTMAGTTSWMITLEMAARNFQLTPSRLVRVLKENSQISAEPRNAIEKRECLN